MTDLKRSERGHAVAARKTDGNPEGKGVNGLMLDWHCSEPRGIAAKPSRQVLAELFTSMLALSAAFKYRPAVGTANHLYWVDGEWSLSLIAPDEWSNERRAGFVGTCVLQRDMTWTISPSDRLGEDNPLSAAVGRFFDAFARTLDSDLTLEEILPFYVSGLPYYQRIYASALGRSVRAAVTLGDQAGARCRDWRRLLPRQKTRLLACAG